MSVIRSLFEGRDGFATKDEIIEFVTRSKNFDPGRENLAQAQTLLFFNTSKQRTWLVATNERLYCILDDLRSTAPNINWSTPKSQLVDGDKITVEVQPRDKTTTTGLVDIGPKHKGWLFTKDLFDGATIEDQVRQVVSKTMLGSSDQT